MNHLRSLTHLIQYSLTPGLLIIGLLALPAAFAQFEADYKMVQIGRIIQAWAKGTVTENAADLLAALTKAQTLTPTATNPVVIDLGPGQFDFGTTVTAFGMPDHVHLHGSGAGVTTLLCDCSGDMITAIGTTNHFRHITIKNINTSGLGVIYATGGAHIVVRDTGTEARLGVSAENSGTTVETYNSVLLSTDDALEVVDKAQVTVEYSRVDGTDSGGDGLITAGGSSNTLVVRYTFIGAAGVENPWAGTATCSVVSMKQKINFTPRAPPWPSEHSFGYGDAIEYSGVVIVPKVLHNRQ